MEVYSILNSHWCFSARAVATDVPVLLLNQPIVGRAPAAQLVSGCHAGGREFDFRLKITEEKVLPLELPLNIFTNMLI